MGSSTVPRAFEGHGWPHEGVEEHPHAHLRKVCGAVEVAAEEGREAHQEVERTIGCEAGLLDGGTARLDGHEVPLPVLGEDGGRARTDGLPVGQVRG